MHDKPKSLGAMKKARQRALKADPFPKPRGRVPRGSNGVPQRWDNQLGGWKDVDAPAWSSTVEFPDLGATVAELQPPAADVAPTIVAAPTVEWEVPTLWQLEASDNCSEKRTRLHEHVQMTPHGSRAHTLEHISPGGTTRLDEYTSPACAPGGATRQQRAACRSRITFARMETRVKCYRTACKHCGRPGRLVGADGRMQEHSPAVGMSARERAAYMQGHVNIGCAIYAEHAWECPGGGTYYGPREDGSGEEESEEEDESD